MRFCCWFSLEAWLLNFKEFHISYFGIRVTIEYISLIYVGSWHATSVISIAQSPAQPGAGAQPGRLRAQYRPAPG